MNHVKLLFNPRKRVFFVSSNQSKRQTHCINLKYIINFKWKNYENLGM